MKLSAKQAAALGLTVPKYRNKRTTTGGMTFDSKKEARRWGELVLLEKARTIMGLERQVSFDLHVNGELICRYVADFGYTENGQWVVEDVKSPATRKNAAYRIKAKLMRAVYGITIRET